MTIGPSLDPDVEEIIHDQVSVSPPMRGLLTTFNSILARIGMYFAVVGLILIVITVAYQVFGRYVLRNPPTWAESLALLLVLYVTLIAAAVGVRDAGHIGLDSLLVLAPKKVREAIEVIIHALVGLFGVAMVYNGWILGFSVSSYKIPGLGLSEGLRYVPLVISGALIVLFSIEHIIALRRNLEVEPAWH